MKVAPWWPEMWLMNDKNGLESRSCLMNVWCELQEYPLKTLLCKVHTRKDKIGALEATNVTDWWRQCTGVKTMAQWTVVKNLKKIHYKLYGWKHTQEKPNWPQMKLMSEENGSESISWCNEYVVLIWRRSIKKLCFVVCTQEKTKLAP